MSRRKWRDPHHHPDPNVLLVAIEGELPPGDLEAVEEHLRLCWQCRARAEDIRRGICLFVDHRELLLTSRVPPPPSGWTMFSALLSRAIDHPAGAPLIHWRRWVRLATGSPAWATAAVTVAALLIAVLAVFEPAPVSAAVFLQRTRAAAVRPPSGKVLVQQIEIRHGFHVLRREVIQGGSEKTLRHASAPAGVPETPAIDWQDPLSIEPFVAWRGALAAFSDRVTAGDLTLTLTTTAGDPVPVRSTSVTVRRHDWHLIARTVEFAGLADAVEVREISRELRTADVPEPGAVPEAVAQGQGTAAGSPDSGAELEDGELALREVLHSLDADVRDAPEIWREDGRVRFTLSPDTPAREAEIVASASRLAGVQYVPAAPSATTAEMPLAPPVATSAGLSRPPLLLDELITHFGSLDLANGYLDRLRDQYLRALSLGSALDGLGRRYAPEQIVSLPPGARRRVLSMAADLTAGLQEESERYLALQAPVLEDMLRRRAVSQPPAAVPQPCRAWQDASPPLLERLRSLHSAFNGLFVRLEGSPREDVPAPAALAEAARLHWLLSSDLQALCQPK